MPNRIWVAAALPKAGVVGTWGWMHRRVVASYGETVTDMDIGWWGLVASLVPVAVAAGVSVVRHQGLERALLVATGEPLDKAGGYGLQGGGEDFVVELVGSRDNVIGLPVTTVLELLATVGPADGAWRRLPGG